MLDFNLFCYHCVQCLIDFQHILFFHLSISEFFLDVINNLSSISHNVKFNWGFDMHGHTSHWKTGNLLEKVNEWNL